MMESTKEFKAAAADRIEARAFRSQAAANAARSHRELAREGRLTWFALHCARAAGDRLETAQWLDRSAARKLRCALALADEGR